MGSQTHKFLVFCGPYAHIGINDSWLFGPSHSEHILSLLISKCAINLETTASGRRIKACHKRCHHLCDCFLMLLSLLLQGEKDTVPLPPKWLFSWGWVETPKLNMPQELLFYESIKVTTSPKDTLVVLSWLHFITVNISHFYKYRKFREDLKETRLSYGGRQQEQ